MATISVLLVDDHAIMREGLRALLSYYPDIQVAGDAHDGAEALDLAGSLNPDVILMDIAMPGMNGLEATQRIRERCPRSRILILTQHEDRQYIVRLLTSGAAGYVLKRAAGADLVNAIRTVAAGDTFLYPPVASAVVDEMRKHPGAADGETEPLTPREKEVLVRIAQGDTSAQIARTLSLSIKTVEWHRANLMSKLGARNLADLVRYAAHHSLLDP